MSSVLIHSYPPRGFYDALDRPSVLPDLSYRRLLAVPPYRCRLSEAELGSGTVELDNSDGFLSTIFVIPPLGVAVDIYGEATQPLFAAYLVALEIQDSTLILRLEV